MKNYQKLLISIISFGVGYSILNGTAQQYVPFAGPDNELGCATIAFAMGMLTFMAIDWKSLLKFLNQ